jgi:hypothetical protein
MIVNIIWYRNKVYQTSAGYKKELDDLADTLNNTQKQYDSISWAYKIRPSGLNKTLKRRIHKNLLDIHDVYHKKVEDYINRGVLVRV